MNELPRLLVVMALAAESAGVFESARVATSAQESLQSVVLPSVFGAVLAFIAGLLALKWLSRWLESGQWYLFGVYCLVAAAGVALLHYRGF